MNQGQIVCSFCSAEFTVPPGLNEAVCPKCGRATPLFTSQIGVGGDDDQQSQEVQWGERPAAIAPPPPPPQAIAPPPPNGGELLGRISLKQVPAAKASPAGRSGSQPGVPRSNGLSALAPTDDQGQLRPEPIRSNTSASDESRFSPAASPPGNGAGFAMGSGPLPAAAGGGVSELAPLGNGNAANLLAELDAELEADGYDDDIPEAEPLVMDPNMEIPEEFSDFFSSDETPGLNLPSDGAIAVNIPTAPIQERMRNEVIAPLVSAPSAATKAPAAPGESGAHGTGKPAGGPSPALRLAIIIGAGVLVLGVLVIWMLL